MQRLISYLKDKDIHNQKLAIARLLLAFGMLLTIMSNDMGKTANTGFLSRHHYTDRNYALAKHDPKMNMPLRSMNLFIVLPLPAAKVVAAIILLLVISGYLPQISCLFHFWVCFSVHNYFYNVNGSDSIALLLSLLLIPVCITDRRINQWQQQPHPPKSINIFSNIAYIAIQFQAAVIYLLAGIAKLRTRVWQDGTAVYYYTSHYRLGAQNRLRAFNELFTLTPLVVILSWGVILFELLLFLCLFAPAGIKRFFLFSGILFHLVILINFGLISFFFSMSALLILYLDDDNIFAKLLHRFQKKVTFNGQ